MSSSYSFFSLLNPFSSGATAENANTILPPTPSTISGLTPLAILSKNFQAEEFLLLQDKIRKLNAVIRLVKKEDKELSPLPNLFAKLKKTDEKTSDTAKADVKAPKAPEEKKSESYVQDLIQKLKNKTDNLLLSGAIRQVGERAHEQMSVTHEKLQKLKAQMNTGPAKDLIIDACSLTKEYVRQLELMINDVLHLISIDENFKSIAEKIAERGIQIITRSSNTVVQLSNQQDQARTIYNNTFEALNATEDTIEKITRDIDRLITFYEEQAKEATKPSLPNNNKQSFATTDAKTSGKTTPHPASKFAKRRPATPIKMGSNTPAATSDDEKSEISPLKLK